MQDLAADDEGRTLPELEHAMDEYLREEDDLESEAALLVERGWPARDDQRLTITDLGGLRCPSGTTRFTAPCQQAMPPMHWPARPSAQARLKREPPASRIPQNRNASGLRL